jgi:hypothetical protein
MVCMIRASFFEKLLKVVCGLLRVTFKISLGGDNELLIGVAGVLVIATFVATGGDRDSLGPLPQLLLVTFGAPLHNPVNYFGWRPLPLLGATFPLLYMKMAPIASSPEACLVAMSRSSFVVFG